MLANSVLIHLVVITHVEIMKEILRLKYTRKINHSKIITNKQNKIKICRIDNFRQKQTNFSNMRRKNPFNEITSIL